MYACMCISTLEFPLGIISDVLKKKRLTLLAPSIIYFKNEIPTTARVLMGRLFWYPSRNLPA